MLRRWQGGRRPPAWLFVGEVDGLAVHGELPVAHPEVAEAAARTSEAVYAEVHANFRSIVEESYKARVWIVSPTTLMATLNTVRAVLKRAED